MDYRGDSSATIDTVNGAAANERSIGDILRDIGTNIQQIVRSEIRLAKIELADTVRRLQASSMMLVGGAVLGFFALGFLLLAAMFALEIVVAAWLAALIIAVILFIGAGLGLSVGRELFRNVPAPEKTLQTVKEDLQWTKEQMRS